MSGSSPAHARLRAATAHDHARVDACFPDGLADAASYRRYLRGMQVLLATLGEADPGLAEDFAGLLEALRQDLGHSVPASLPPAPRIPCAMARLGVRYVIDGSALGARLLLRQVHALGPNAGAGTAFLAYHVERSQQAWPALQHALASQDPASPPFTVLLDSARNTFALAADCFRREQAEPPGGPSC
ncbi:biliverdin-producing heme oxygenase [Luteimonas sp. e5]